MADTNTPEELQGEEQKLMGLIYDKVNDAVGGNNPNQMLTLLLPGISLAQEDYKYDLDKTKPIVVEANESRLVNKLYDPYELCVADNGKTLQNQYKSALNLLSPKLNAKIAKAKNMMRRFLLTKYPDMDPEKIDTLQEKYFELFQNYLNASEKWAEIQKNKRDELKAFYKLDNPDFTPDQNKEAYANYNNAYLEWYQIYAEAELNIVNKERARILTVFTPNDMNIIEGILDCGSGAELNEARRTLENTRKLNPDGGYTYPVKLVPSNWFENLDTSIPAIDLLQSPTILKDELALAKTRQITLAAKIQALGDSLAKTEESLDSATKNLKTNLDTFNTCHEALASFGEASILNFAKECVSAYMTMDASTLEKQVTKKNESDAGQEPQSSENKTDEQKKDDNKKLYVELYTNAKKIENVDGIKDNTDYKNLINSLKDCVTIQTNGNGSETVSGKISTNPTQELVNNLFSVFTSQCKEINKLQNQAVTATSDLLKSLQSVTANKGEYKMQSDLLTKLQPQYDELCARVNELETEMNLSANIQNASTFTQYEPPKGYASVTIIHKSGVTETAEEQKVTVKVNKQTAGFWIFKKTKTKSNKDTAIKKICTQEGTEIRIGMNVAKVAIEREWFNPGVFNLTSDMVNYSENNLQISQGSFEDEQNKNDSIFPCYPVAMLIARDVSINIKTSSSTNSTDIRTAEEETANSSSFLVFHKNNGNSSSSSKSKCSTSFSEDGLNIRIADPQVIGFYLQATPKDNSQPAETTSMSSMEGFIDSYKNMLLEIQKDFTK